MFRCSSLQVLLCTSFSANGEIKSINYKHELCINFLPTNREAEGFEIPLLKVNVSLNL